MQFSTQSAHRQEYLSHFFEIAIETPMEGSNDPKIGPTNDFVNKWENLINKSYQCSAMQSPKVTYQALVKPLKWQVPISKLSPCFAYMFTKLSCFVSFIDNIGLPMLASPTTINAFKIRAQQLVYISICKDKYP